MTTTDIDVLLRYVRKHPANGWQDSQTLASYITGHPDIRFYFEVGNEPNVNDNQTGRPAFDTDGDADFDATDAARYHDRLIQIADFIHTYYNYSNLTLLASMPTTNTYISMILGDGQVASRFDGIGIHLYGDSDFTSTDGPFPTYSATMSSVRTYAAGESLFVTETGICNPNLGKQTKAQRMRDWYLRNAGPNKIAGVVLFTLDHWTGACVNSTMGEAGYGVESLSLATTTTWPRRSPNGSCRTLRTGPART